MEETKKDLAKGTFIENWPKWIRWLLFVPASIVVPVLFFLFYSLMQTWFLGLGENAFYINLLRGVIYGGGFVYVAASVAPSKQKIVALVYLIIIAMLTGMNLIASFTVKSTFNEILETFIMLTVAAITTYYIFHEENLK